MQRAPSPPWRGRKQFLGLGAAKSLETAREGVADPPLAPLPLWGVLPGAPMPTLGLAIAAIAALVSFFTTWFILRRAGKLGLMQQPNGRSSHVAPTPGGGGVGIVAGGSVAGLLMALLLPWLGVPVIMAGILLAFIGYSDDKRPIAARWRLGAQVLLMGAIVAVLPIDQLGLPVPGIGAAGAPDPGRRAVDQPVQLHGRHRWPGCVGGDLPPRRRCAARLPVRTRHHRRSAAVVDARPCRRMPRLPAAQLAARQDFHGRRRQHPIWV